MAVKVLPANGLDLRMLALADSHSAEEISDMLGRTISPAKVALHIKTLLKSKNFLDDAEKDQLITIRMNNILLELEGRHMDIDHAKARLATLKALGDRLDKRRAATTADLNMLYDNQGAIMGRVVDIAMSYIKGAFREEIDPALWDATVKEALEHAEVEIAKHEAIEA